MRVGVTATMRTPKSARMMRIYCLAGAAFLLVAGASRAEAQLLSERTEGLSRICSYAGVANTVSGGTPRTHRVGIGESCPFSYPARSVSSLPAPPSAGLRSETLTDAARICLYEQMGESWSLSVPMAQSCPLYAGMIPDADIEARRRTSTPAFGPSRPPPPERRRGRR